MPLTTPFGVALAAAFAVGKAADAAREARIGETVKSGFEGVDPSDLKGGKVTALAA